MAGSAGSSWFPGLGYGGGCLPKDVQARAAVGGSLAGRRIGVLGVAFKPGSDDVRDSASLEVCDQLAAEAPS